MVRGFLKFTQENASERSDRNKEQMSELERVVVQSGEGSESVRDRERLDMIGREAAELENIFKRSSVSPRIKMAVLEGVLALSLLGGCGVSLLDVAVKGGLKVEPYRPPVVRYESLPSYSWGRGHVDSGGGTGTWHGYGLRNGKVVPIWEEVGPRRPKR